MARDVMLTTVDNPYNPFTDFAKWFAFDSHHGYDTCGLVARLTQTSAEFSETRQLREIERAIDEFVELDPLKHYVKVTKK